MAHVWLAGVGDAQDVARLIGGFRDWWGKDEPRDEVIRATVGRLIADPNTEYLLAAPAEGERAGGVCQLRYRLSVWSGHRICDRCKHTAAWREGMSASSYGSAGHG